MPRKASSKAPKKTTTKKKAMAARKPRQKVVQEEGYPAPLQPLPETFIISPSLMHGHTIHESNTHQTPNQKPRRHLVVVFCISVIMVIIVGAWIMNLRRFINQNATAAPENSQRQTDFVNLKAELDSTLGEIRGQLDKFDEIKEAETIAPTATPGSEEKIKKIFEEKAQESTTTTVTSPVTPTQTPILPN